MNDPARKSLIFKFVVAIAILVSLLTGLFNGWYQVVFELAWGWIAFLERTIPNVGIRWDGVLIFVVGTLAFGGLLHYMLSWMVQATNSQNDPNLTVHSWRLKWTVLLVATIEFAFVAGVATIGVTHQSAWLMRSDDPAFGIQYSGYESNLSYKLRQQALDTDCFDRSHHRLPRDTKLHSWITELMGLGHYSVQTEGMDFSQPWNSETNSPSFKRPHPSLLNPNLTTDSFYDEQGFGLSHFAGNKEIFTGTGRRSLADLESLSNTVLVGEINSGFMPWGQPGNVRDVTAPINRPDGFGEVTRGRIVTALADGSARVFTTDVDPDVMRRFAGSFKGEAVERE